MLGESYGYLASHSTKPCKCHVFEWFLLETWEFLLVVTAGNMTKGKRKSTNKKLPSQHESFQGFGLASAVELSRVGGAGQRHLSEVRDREEAVRYVQKLWGEEGCQRRRKNNLSGWWRNSDHYRFVIKLRTSFYPKLVLWAMSLLSFVLNSPSPLLRIQADQLVRRWFLWLNNKPKFLITSMSCVN